MIQMNNAAESAQSFSLVVRKSERKLVVYHDLKGVQHLVTTSRIALGNRPRGARKKQGDGATPEGEYYITHKNAASKCHLSLGLSYRNLADALGGLDRGLIGKRQYESLARALGSFKRPLQNTVLGGDIFIDGGGTSNDWTVGCIALDDTDIELLFAQLPLKTQVTILP